MPEDNSMLDADRNDLRAALAAARSALTTTVRDLSAPHPLPEGTLERSRERCAACAES